MHYFITSPCSFTPPLVQARAPKWTFFNHHFTVVFWLIVIESTQVYSLRSTRPTAWNSTHHLVCCLKVDFIYSMAKQKFPTTKAECKQHPAAVLCVTVKTSVPEKKRGGEFWNRSDTRAKLTFDTKQNALGSRCHQWSVMVEPEISQVNVHYQRGVKSGLDRWHSTIRLFN